MSAAVPIDRTKLARILGMLGSDHPGERAAAGLKATQALQAAGLTWGQVLQPPPAVVLQVRPEATQSHCRDGRADTQFCLKHCEQLNTWERKFVGSVCRQSRMTAAQTDKLRQIAADLRSRGFV